MTFRPGNRFVAALAALAVWSVAGLFWPALDDLVGPLLVALLALAAVDLVRVRRALGEIDLDCAAPTPVARNQPFRLSLVLANPAPRPWHGQVRVEVPSAAQPRLWIERALLPSAGTARMLATFCIPQRGRYQFGPLWLRITGPFGLVEAQRRWARQRDVQVYPESLLSPHELAKDAADEIRLMDQLRHTRHHGVGAEFESLEEFRRGDDPRHIDWRATARHRRPVVRRFQVERHRDIMLLVDCGRLMGADAQRGSKLDCAVDAALRLLRIALRGGDRCGLGIFSDRVHGYLRPIGGSNRLPTFLASLYDLQPQWRETDFGPMFARLQSRLTKRALVIVLSDVVDAETSTRYRTSLATLAQRHVVLFAALQTPLLGGLVAGPLRTLDDGFKKAVAFRILREREQAIHALRRSSVQVLDVEPSRLTAPLINQLIALRRSSRL